MSATYDAVVIGAGAFGAWTALSLTEAGARVLLVDAYGAGNAMASSGGESRNIRAAYGERELYTRWSIRAWHLWLEREREFEVRLLYPSGGLRLLPAADAKAQSAMFDRLGHPNECLTTTEVGARWPQIRYEGDEVCLYEPQSGTLAARDALVAVAQAVARKGGDVVVARVTPPSLTTGRLGTIAVGGAMVSAGSFVFACGPWLPRLFPELLGTRIKTPRRELFFLGPAPRDDRYRWDRCPSLTDPLGWTSSDIGGGVKIAPIIRHVLMDPDFGDRMPTAALLGQVRRYAASRLPGLADCPVVGTYVSQLENTDNDHFLIDCHPELADVVIAGGGSGHAYKMGPVIGEHVAAMVLAGTKSPELADTFGLATHAPVAADQGG